jgi:mRNA interferase RelE/StbE
MIVSIDKTFEKDTNKIKLKNILNEIADIIENTQKAKNIIEIKNIKKLKGYKKYYRIKLEDYRLGLFIDNDKVEFVRCLHRKDIYKYFPK